MSPWEVIQEALVRKRPVRNLQWLADQVGVSIQVVSNWKARGVPARRYRDIAAVLDLTVDQIEGIAALPWEPERPPVAEFSDEVRQVALEIDALPKRQRDWVLRTLHDAIEMARETLQPTPNTLSKPQEPPVEERFSKSSRMMKRMTK